MVCGVVKRGQGGRSDYRRVDSLKGKDSCFGLIRFVLSINGEKVENDL